MRAGLCIGVLESHISAFFFFRAVLAAAAAVSCRRCHAGRQAHKPFTLWRPRQNSSRSASLCGPLLCVCWHRISVCDVCVPWFISMWHVFATTYCCDVQSKSQHRTHMLNRSSCWLLLFISAIQQTMPNVSSNTSCNCATCEPLLNMRHCRDLTPPTSPTSRTGTLYQVCI